MALSYSEANVSNKGNTTNTSGYTLAHTPVANTKAIVAITTQYDSSSTDINISAGTPTWNGIAMTEAELYKSSSGYGQVSIHYYPNPDIAAGTFSITFAGANTDAQTTIIDLVDSAADTVWLDTTNTGTTSSTTSHGCNVTSAVAGSIGIAGIVNEDAVTTDTAPTTPGTTGTLTSGSEADMGSQCAEVAYQATASGTATFTWTKADTTNSYACAATFYSITTTVTLDDPTAGETVTDTTPPLTFHGHTTDKDTTDNIEYQLQVDTATTFDSQNGGAGSLTIGSTASDRAAFYNEGYTLIDNNTTASANGLITSVEIWAATSLTGCKVGTFYNVGGTTYTCRDYETIGNVTSGSKQTFSSLSINTQTGDRIGIYYATGQIERDSGGSVFVSGADGFSSSYSYSSGGNTISLYAVGYTLAPLLSSLSTDALGDYEAGHPWDDAEEVTYTVGSALADSTTHYWRVRGKDVATGVWGAWSTGAGSGYESFVVNTGGAPPAVVRKNAYMTTNTLFWGSI